MGFIPLICRCYMFLYIRLPFNRNFWEVPKYTLFASQKKRDLGFHRYGIPSYFSFPEQSFIELIQSFLKFTSIIESFILYFLVSFLVSFWIFCPPFYVSCPLFCLLYWVSVHFYVHHLHNLAYLFIVLEFTLGFILGSLKVLGFILSYCHSIRWKMENVKISPCFRQDYVKI